MTSLPDRLRAMLDKLHVHGSPWWHDDWDVAALGHEARDLFEEIDSAQADEIERLRELVGTLGEALLTIRDDVNYDEGHRYQVGYDALIEYDRFRGVGNSPTLAADARGKKA